MIKDYRRRFVISTMLLVGLVLLVAFGVIGAVIARSEYNQLKNTMSLVISPWEGADDRFRPVDIDDGMRPDRPQPPEREGRTVSEDIAAVIYDTESGEISVLSDQAIKDTLDISGAAKAIALQKEDFGTLRDYDVIYYKEGLGRSIRIAIASTSYIRAIMLRNALILTASFAGTMALVFLVSLKLARKAAKPMEDAMEMERQFVADISHDLKTPITVVLANSSILKDSKDSTVAEQMQWVENTEQAARNMMDLVGEMLDLSVLDQPGRKFDRQRVDLSAAAEKCVLQMESLAFEKGVEFSSEIADGAEVLADKDHVQRIVSGLIDNALKYEPMGGRVDVTVVREKKKALLKVLNHGSYISPEDLPHIFERFYRSDKARSEKKGYGLGLPIISKMAELSGARIYVQSSESDGTSFTVEFESV